MTSSKYKIAVFDGMAQPQKLNSYVGGMEMVSRCQARYLSEKHDVTFVVTQDSDDLSEEGYNVEFTSQRGKYPLRYEGINTRGYNRIFYDDIHRILDKVQPDVAIFQRVYPFNGKSRIENLPCASVFFEHSLPEYLGQNMLNIPKLADRIHDSGHVFTCVSKTATDRYNTKCSKLTGEDRAFIYHFTPIQVVKSVPEDILEHDNYGIVISRWCPLKNPGKAIDMFQYRKNQKYGLKMFTSQLQTDPIYEKKFPKYVGKGASTYLDVSLDKEHAEIMDVCKRATFHITTCQYESSGIASLEAATYGVPNIVFAPKGKHATSHHMMPGHNHMINTTEVRGLKNQTQEFWDIIHNIDFSLESRKKLSQWTCENFSPEKFVERHESVIRAALLHYDGLGGRSTISEFME